VYLVDTDVITARKGDQGDAGVEAFFKEAKRNATALYVSAVTIGELRQAVEQIRHRGDVTQAARLSSWLDKVVSEFNEAILPFDEEAAQVWGRLRVPNPESPIDKQIAATAMINGLTVVTRKTALRVFVRIVRYLPLTIVRRSDPALRLRYAELRQSSP
jgi:predicted nucleic acid-binding protein